MAANISYNGLNAMRGSLGLYPNDNSSRGGGQNTGGGGEEVSDSLIEALLQYPGDNPAGFLYADIGTRIDGTKEATIIVDFQEQIPVTATAFAPVGGFILGLAGLCNSELTFGLCVMNAAGDRVANGYIRITSAGAVNGVITPDIGVGSPQTGQDSFTVFF